MVKTGSRHSTPGACLDRRRLVTPASPEFHARHPRAARAFLAWPVVTDSPRATVAIWIAAAIVGGLALLHFARADAGGGGGSAVRVNRPADNGGAAHPG